MCGIKIPQQDFALKRQGGVFADTMVILTLTGRWETLQSLGCWTWVILDKNCSSVIDHLILLAYFHQLLPTFQEHQGFLLTTGVWEESEGVSVNKHCMSSQIAILSELADYYTTHTAASKKPDSRGPPYPKCPDLHWPSTHTQPAITFSHRPHT